MRLGYAIIAWRTSRRMARPHGSRRRARSRGVWVGPRSRLLTMRPGTGRECIKLIGNCSSKSTDETSFLSQEIERGQKWQAKDGEMIRFDALEQMHAITLELIGADARHHGSTGRFEIRGEGPIAESTHGHARNLHRFTQHFAIPPQRTSPMQ